MDNRLLLPSLLAQPRLRHAFSDAEDGNLSYTWGEPDEVLAARTAFLEKLGWKPEDCVGMPLDHKAHIETVGNDERGRDMLPPVSGEPLDALVTDTLGLPLFLITADCLPCIVYDPVRPALGLAHLGSRSAEAGLVGALVRLLQEKYGSQPDDLVVGIGPGIHRESYLLPSFEQESLAEWQPFVSQEPDGQVRVDLPGFVAAQFVSAGVQPKHIEISPADTAADPTLFSHYRSVRTGEPEARFATVAWITP